jgi:pimeloyl-ACP methyl ester carboxylesterase
MSTIKTRDGIKIAYKDCGKGQPILFSHGWPLWEALKGLHQKFRRFCILV